MKLPQNFSDSHLSEQEHIATHYLKILSPYNYQIKYVTKVYLQQLKISFTVVQNNTKSDLLLSRSRPGAHLDLSLGLPCVMFWLSICLCAKYP